MAEKPKPAGNSRRKFIKDLGAGMVGAYTIAPNINLNSQTLKQTYIDALEGKIDLSLKVNGKNIKTKVQPNMTLAEFLRDELELTGTKLVCNHGECGSCTVLLNEKPVYSCHILALDADGANILTVEGLMDGEDLNSIQESFVQHDGLQCGFCTPGQIISAYALLRTNSNPTDTEIMAAMSGNLCRCGAYPKIFDSVKKAVLSNNQ
jgi:aerobic-type carbon monoxide dehydrogenase small subunit (CoxS/CutS family)